eukprot:CAMPEP_0113729124 /NCGR_PEP_ID=MMETSP0038_2-20120614/42347_1 /TAXON_ID=2898 /ORGANISM="Cryptomonas paramecium" /LENGTH=111 /DNA_ID=CAMNT_0000660875 /DNA_START=155 /DNA_END=488 /DNA_ORIENTATION=+ /assembly_acc=CAM_ASM_000170
MQSEEPEPIADNSNDARQTSYRTDSRSILRKPTARLQRLKDLLTKKDALEVLAIAELSLKVDLEDSYISGLRSMATIDYNRISSRIQLALRAVRDIVPSSSAVMSFTELDD